MKVVLAGFNIDKELIDQIEKQQQATPETISAAYARISRSKKSVTELRRKSLTEVEKARKSNESILFEMGHSSIAEHAVFNFDLLGVSRLLSESVQKSRLASFTEKSQRYVTLDGDFVIPEEIRGLPLEKKFVQTVTLLNELYNKLYHKALEYLKDIFKDEVEKLLEGRAKEDARFVLPLATETQMGMTINARSLERLLRRLDSIQLKEAQELRSSMAKMLSGLAPSLIKYTNSDEIEEFKICHKFPQKHTTKSVDLISITENADERILAGMIFESCSGNYQEILEEICQYTEAEKEALYEQLFAKLKSYHVMPRAFELVDVTLQLSLSASCFAQLKRHRMASVLKSDYHPLHGYILPPLIKQLNMNKQIEEAYAEANSLFYELEELKPGLGNYVITNGHLTTIIFKCNLRELYHFSRLRSDEHAQWEIQDISHKISKLLQDAIPLAGKYLMGKSEFKKEFQRS